MAGVNWGKGQPWEPNMEGTRLHRAVSGYTGRGTGVVAACDKQGIYLDPRPVPDGLPKCKLCLRLAPDE